MQTLRSHLLSSPSPLRPHLLRNEPTVRYRSVPLLATVIYFAAFRKALH